MKFLRGILLMVIAAAMVIVPTATSVFAHTPYGKIYCGGLGAAFEQYEDNAAHNNNHLTIYVDGVVKISTDFGSSYGSRNAQGDPAIVVPWADTADHTYRVVLNANIHSGDATAYDIDQSGTSTKCVQPTTTTTTTTTTTLPETTTTTTVKPTTTTSSTTTTSTTQPATTTSTTTTVPETSTSTTQPREVPTTTTTRPTTTTSTSSTTTTTQPEATTSTSSTSTSTTSTTQPAATTSTTTTTVTPVIVTTSPTPAPTAPPVAALPVTGIRLTTPLYFGFTALLTGVAILVVLAATRRKKSA